MNCFPGGYFTDANTIKANDKIDKLLKTYLQNVTTYCCGLRNLTRSIKLLSIHCAGKKLVSIFTGRKRLNKILEN